MDNYMDENFIHDEYGPNTPMCGYEYDYIRVRVGLTWKSVGKQAKVIGRDKPYSISAIRIVKYDKVVKLKYVFMLFSSMPEEMFRQLRNEWKEEPVYPGYAKLKQEYCL